MSLLKKIKSSTKEKRKNKCPTFEDILNLKPGEGIWIPKGCFEVVIVDGEEPAKRKRKKVKK